MLDLEERGIVVIVISVLVATGTLVSISLFAYDIKYALGLDAPKLVLKEAGGMSAPFANATIGDVEQMRNEYPFWFFDGSALVRGGDYVIYQHDTGLYVGVADPNVNDRSWSGMFAMSPPSHASIYHSRISVPLYANYTNGSYMNVGIYVQTDPITPAINYVDCTMDIREDLIIRRVESGLGTGTMVTNRTVYWEEIVSLDQNEMDCILVTNGDDYFRAIIDGKTVFEGQDLDLRMPRPFNAYLETQVYRYPEVKFGIFQDYWSMKSQEVTVIGLRPYTNATLGDITATADHSGTVTFNISDKPIPYHASLRAIVETGEASINAAFLGGDVYEYQHLARLNPR